MADDYDYEYEERGDKPKKRRGVRGRWNDRKKRKAANKSSKRKSPRSKASGVYDSRYRGGKDGARLPRIQKELSKDYEKINDRVSQPKTPKQKAAGAGKSPKEARQWEQQRRADRAADEAKKRRLEQERKNSPEYKRGMKHLGDAKGRTARPQKAPPIPRDAAIDPVERARLQKFGQKQTKSAPKGATRNKYGTSFESPKERSTRKGQFTKTRRKSMRKKYASKDPSPVSYGARQRARDINTMNRSKPKNTGNIYADKDLARKKKEISSRPTYRPSGPGPSDAEYKAVAKKGLNAKYGKASRVGRAAGKVARIGTKAIPVLGTAQLAADAALITKKTHDRQKGRKRWFDSPEGKNYKKYHKNRKDASAKKFAKTGKPNMKYTQAWNKKSNAPRYPSRSEFEAMGRAKSRPKPSTRPARNKPKPKKKYNRRETWG